MAVRVFNRTIDPSAGFAGTLTCVVHVSNDPAHCVAISAAHVLAPLTGPGSPVPQENDEVIFEMPGGNQLTGRLWAWIELQRRVDGFSNRFDAALVTIDGANAATLIAALGQPSLVADAGPAGPLAFSGVTSSDSGPFQGPAGSDSLIYPVLGGGLASLAFEGSFRLDATSDSGDSGALVTSQSRGVGMLIAHEGLQSRFVPLKPLLKEFDLSWPGAALPVAALAPATPPPAPVVAGDALDTLARTLWGEARGEPLNGIRAVAAVVMNRVEHPRIRWWGIGVVGVCRASQQFSCWNGADPNLPKLLAVDGTNDKFRLCLDVAQEAVDGRLQNRVKDATHYHHKSILPDWARGKVPCEDIRNHLFYNDIER